MTNQLYEELYANVDSELVDKEEFFNQLDRIQRGIFYSDCRDDYSRGQSEIAEAKQELRMFITENANDWYNGEEVKRLVNMLRGIAPR